MSRSIFEQPTKALGPKYLAAVDGLRGISVILVLGFHLGVPGFAGGYLGVDAFFVISGFLITRIILSQLGQGSFSYSRFLLKRANRLLPALTVMSVMTTLGAWIYLDRGQLRSFGDSLIGVGTYVSNYVFMLD